MPAEKTTTCVSMTVVGAPSSVPACLTRRPVTASPPSISSVRTPVWTFTPSFSMCRTSVAPAAPSSWTGISRGAISTTLVCRPSWTSALAASSPSSPPPMTTPLVAVRLAALIASRSSMVR